MGGARLYRNFATEGRLFECSCELKENQISQVKEFSTFLLIGRCKSLGSLKSFL